MPFVFSTDAWIFTTTKHLKTQRWEQTRVSAYVSPFSCYEEIADCNHTWQHPLLPICVALATWKSNVVLTQIYFLVIVCLKFMGKYSHHEIYTWNCNSPLLQENHILISKIPILIHSMALHVSKWPLLFKSHHKLAIPMCCSLSLSSYWEILLLVYGINEWSPYLAESKIFFYTICIMVSYTCKYVM